MKKKQKKAPLAFFDSMEIKNSKENSLMSEGSNSLSSLLTLPKDPWTEIFSRLKPFEAGRVARTCKFFNKLKNEKPNDECYLIVEVLKKVESPEDFMNMPAADKESEEKLEQFGEGIFSIHATAKEAYKEQLDLTKSNISIVKVKLSFPYVKSLLVNSSGTPQK